MKYEFHPEAEEEFIEAAVRHEAEVLGLGERFGAEVYRAIELLLESPELAPRIDVDIRRFILRRFPFSLIHSITPGMLHILAVAHGHRKPGYWQSRVDR